MRLATAMIVATLMVAPVFAQFGPPDGGMPPEGQLTAVQENLGLSSTQVESLKALQQETREAMKPYMEQMRTNMQALREQFRAETPDGTAIAQIRSRIETLREEMKAKRTEFHTQAINVLTADQQAKLAALQEALSLQRAAHEAIRLNLLEVPEGAGLFGPRGFGGFGGHGRALRGRGFGPPKAE